MSSYETTELMLSAMNALHTSANEDEHYVSKVLYFRHVPFYYSQKRLQDLVEPFAHCTKIVMIRKHNAFYKTYDLQTHEVTNHRSIRALVEVQSIDTAKALVERWTAYPLTTDDGQEIAVTYSKSPNLREHDTPSRPDKLKENRILITTIQVPTYPITTIFMGEIFAYFGKVEKVVVFSNAKGLKCLVQMSTIEDAFEVKSALDGLHIFPNSCHLHINFSNLEEELDVTSNGFRKRDFCNPDLPATENDYIIGHDRESPVLLVYNLHERAECDHIFNLFSCYGNVENVKKLSTQKDHALVQFREAERSRSALLHLRGATLFGRTLEITYSNHTYVAVRARRNGGVYDRNVRVYGNGLNRSNIGRNSHNQRVNSPTKILHISNLDENATEEDLREHLDNFESVKNYKLKIFTAPSGHIQAHSEYPSASIATNVLATAHNSTFNKLRIRITFSTHNLHHRHD